jgi:actin-related protein
VHVTIRRAGVPIVHAPTQAVLSAFATGRTDGLVLLSGGNTTCTVPIYEGCMLPHAIERLDLGGQDVTEWLAGQLVRGAYGPGMVSYIVTSMLAPPGAAYT